MDLLQKAAAGISGLSLDEMAADAAEDIEYLDDDSATDATSDDSDIDLDAWAQDCGYDDYADYQLEQQKQISDMGQL